jgi:predicted molibdopterin-dependent oxidoreductase YjgC
MWKLLSPDTSARIALFIDGRAVTVPADISVAAAMLATGMEACRTTPVRGAPRGPYCHMGVCFDCLVTIDGVPNRQACMVSVADGMRVESQERARGVTL